MGGWFRREIKSREDMRGLKIRSLGLGGEVYRRLGATPQTTPPAEILTSLQSGVLDAAEFVGPGSDIALGLYRVAPIYYAPGFNKPNGTGECIVSLKAWNALDAGHEGDRGACLRGGGRLRAVRDGAAQCRGAACADHAAQRAARDVSGRPDRRGARRKPTACWPSCAAQRERARKVHDSYVAFRERVGAWSRISLRAVLEARG